MLLKGYFAKAFSLVLLAFVLLAAGSAALAQTATFTYQGRLEDGGTPANGSYDLQLTLWDAGSGGTQQPQPSPVTVTRTAVLVTGGIFSVSLDFGASAFPGADRFLEIGVRPAGGGAFTILAPRQQTTSTPYAIRSASATTANSATTATTATTANNATQLGGVAASQYVLTGDSRLTDSRAPTAGSVNYVQNTTSQQASSNFNISGNGTAGGTLASNIINATTQYNIGGNRVLIAPGSSNLFVGAGAGASNTLGSGNSFFGNNAGNNNSTGLGNSFFGVTAGLHNTTGQKNSFFGSSAGFGNLVAGSTGSDNSFFGNAAGLANSTGFNNSFFGSQAGQNNQTGNNNSFFGFNASGADGISNATAIGANASVTTSNSLVLGNNANVVIGSTFPCSGNKLTVTSNTLPFPVCGPVGAIVGLDDTSIGVDGSSNSGTGVFGNSASGRGVEGQSDSGLGVQGSSFSGPGVRGGSTSGNPFEGFSGFNADLVFRVRNDGQVRSNVGFTTPAADFAELIEADESRSPETESSQPGDVLVISPETGKLRKSNQPYSTLVAGIYSTKPGFLGNQGIKDANPAQMVPVALVGVVPTKVSAENGAIHPGDLLTTSSTPGYAMKASPVIVGGVEIYRTGTILGKALEPLKEGKGVIKVLVTSR